MKKYICTVCEYIYDPAQGDPESGIEPGTAFEDIPDDWTCPLCGVGGKPYQFLLTQMLPHGWDALYAV